MGDDVVHAAFGDGVVIGVEPGGIVVVRFAGDGSRAQADGRLRADPQALTRARRAPGCGRRRRAIGRMLGRDDHGEGEPLVLLHGVATQPADLAPRLRRRSPAGRRVDRRRHARLRRLAAGRPRVRARRGRRRGSSTGSALERFDLVGHSLGGAVAVAVAARHPEARPPARPRRARRPGPARDRRRRGCSAPRRGARDARAPRARLPLGGQRRARAGRCSPRRSPTPARLAPDDARLMLDGLGRRAPDRRRRPAGARGRPARRPRRRADARRADLGRRRPRRALSGLEALTAAAPRRGGRDARRAPATSRSVEARAEFVAALERLLRLA